MQPDFGRIYQALKRQEPDRVPLAELHVDLEVKEAFLSRPIRSVKDEIDFWYQAGYDYAQLSYGLMVGEVVNGRKRGTSIVHTFYGEGGHEVEWADEGTGIITSEEDFEAYPWDTLRHFDYASLEEASRYLPEGMKIMVYAGKIFSRVWMMMGFNAFCYSLMDNPSLVERMFEISGQISYEGFEKAIGFDSVGGIWVSDDIAYAEALMIPPEWYRRFLFPWYKQMGQVCRERGLLFVYHSDGNLWEVMEDIIDMGFDALHPIEPKAMDIRELKKEFGDRLSLIGNIDLGYTLTLGTPQEVEEEVKERIRDIASGGGYCVGSSNSVTYYVPLQNYQAMRQATFRYGRYPIKL